MLEVRKKEAVQTALSVMPERLCEEIRRIALGRREGISGIREIRLRSAGRCSMLIGFEWIRLYTAVRGGRKDIRRLALRSQRYRFLGLRNA